jgi:hypothetical protein
MKSTALVSYTLAAAFLISSTVTFGAAGVQSRFKEAANKVWAVVSAPKAIIPASAVAGCVVVYAFLGTKHNTFNPVKLLSNIVKPTDPSNAPLLTGLDKKKPAADSSVPAPDANRKTADGVGV